MPRRDIEKELEALKALRTAPPADQLRILRKALRDSVNLIVARAAAVTASLQLRPLIPELCQAFDRMLTSAAQRDPQCWAKTAIAKALADLEYTESGVFLRGLHHVQLEAGWGRSEDTAFTLRGTCALAMATVRDLPRREILQHLLLALSDSYDAMEPFRCAEAAPVRRDAVRAVEQMQGEEAGLLLRLKARMGDPDSSVTGQVFDALLALEGPAAVSFVGSFLNSVAESVPEEAAVALGASHLPTAASLLVQAWPSARQESLREAMLRGLSASRDAAATEFLVDLVQQGRAIDAAAALNAMSLYPQAGDLYERLAQAASARTEDAIHRALQSLLRVKER